MPFLTADLPCTHCLASMEKLTLAQRRELGEAGKAGKSITSLSRKYKCSRGVARHWVQKAKKPRPNYFDAPRSGRPAKLSSAERSRVRRSARRGHTCPQISTSLNRNRQEPVSKGTVRKVLVDGKNALQWAPVSRGRRLGEVNVQKRFTFCQDHLTAHAGAWLYCDSKQLFCYPEGNSNNTYSWQEINEQPQQRAGSNPVVFHVYAVAGKGFKSQLVYTAPSAPKGSKQRRGKENFASRHFIEVAKQLHKTIKAAGKNSSRHPIVLDGAKPHTSDATSAAIEVMGLHILEGFPPQSWDLNIIENVWGVLDTKLKGFSSRQPTTPDGWRRRINRAWNSIPQSTIDKLVGSVKDRIAAVVEKEGAWLFPHK